MKPKIYASKNITNYIRRLTNKRFVKSGLIIECFPDATIVVAKAKNCFGIFDKNGVFVKQSMMLRGKGQLIPSADDFEKPDCFDCDAVFLGNIDKAFGHYILEHWTRAYAFLDEKYKNCKYVLVNDMRFESVPNFVTELARLLGIPAENFVILSESAKFRNVYVPESSFKLVQFSSKEFGKIYAKIAENVEKNYDFDKIYLSRAALKTRKTYGEEKVQKIFEKNGYKIIYPEQLPLEEQIALMKNCKSLAGCAGTALHLALFMNEGGKVIQIRRNKNKDGNCGTQYLINEAKNLDLVYIDASVEKYKTNHGSDKAQIIGVNKYMTQFFDDNKFEYSKEDMEFDKKSWDEYIIAAEKYEADLREKYGGRSKFQIWILGRILKWTSFFIFNRKRRIDFRAKMRKSWGIL